LFCFVVKGTDVWYQCFVLFCCERNRRVVPIQHMYDVNDDEKVLLGIMVVLYQWLVGNRVLANQALCFS